MALLHKFSAVRWWAWAVVLYGVIRLLLIPIGASFTPESYSYVPEPSSSVFNRIVVRPWERWDVEYYVKIARDGYQLDPATRNFYPLYPWISRVFGGNWVISLLLTSAIATIALYLLLAALARVDQLAMPRWAAVCLMVLPTAFILYAPYTESLFLAFAVAAFLFARFQRWWLAALMASGATLTRQQGIILVLPLLVEMIQADGNWRATLRKWHWLSLALPLLTLVGFVVYRAVSLGDLPDQWWLPQNWIYSIFISPEAQRVVPNQRFVLPWTALYLAIKQLFEPTYSASLVARSLDLVLGFIYLGLFAWAWRSLRWSYRLYCGLVFVLAFCYHTGTLFAYMGLSRHLLLAFPLAFPIATWSSQRQPRQFLIIVLALALLIIQTFLFVTNAWVV